MRVGALVASTSIHISPWPALKERLDPLFQWPIDKIEANRAEYARQIDAAILESTLSLERAVEEELGDRIEVVVVPWSGPRTGGPTPPQSEIVYFLGLAGDLVGRVVDLAALYVLIKGGVKTLAKVSGDRVIIDDGIAILKASEAVFAATATADLTLAFVTPLSAHRVDLQDMDPGDDGYLVGFRDVSELVLVRVDSFGEVRILAERIALPQRSSLIDDARGDPESDED